MAGAEADRSVHPIGPRGDHITDQSLMNLFDRLLQGRVMTAHQTARDLQILGLGGLPGLDHSSDSRGIHRERFFHEHMATFGDGILEVQGPKGRWRGKDHRIAGVERIDRFAIAIEADELPVGGDIGRFGKTLFELRDCSVQSIRKYIRHRPKLGWAFS